MNYVLPGPPENEGWSTDFPLVPGEYWFHGWTRPNRDQLPRMTIVRVIRVVDGRPQIMDDGCEWLHEGRSFGLFRPYIRPPAPAVDRGACVMVLNRDGTEVLVSRRHDHVASLAGMLQFPGGAVEDDETTEQGALRELREETGIYARGCEGWFDQAWHGVSKGRPYSVNVHIVRDVGAARHAEPEKNGPWTYMSIEAILQGDMPCIPGLRESLRHAKAENRLVPRPEPPEDKCPWLV